MYSCFAEPSRRTSEHQLEAESFNQFGTLLRVKYYLQENRRRSEILSSSLLCETREVPSSFLSSCQDLDGVRQVLGSFWVRGQYDEI